MLLGGCTAPPPPVNPDGKAVVYVQPDAKHAAGVRADLALPRVEGNASWYATWVVALPDGAPDAVGFVQVGLIRRPGNADSAAAFTAYRYPGATLHRSEYARMRGERARVAIVIDGDRVRLSVGSRTLWSGSKTQLFAHATGLHYQLGDEVSGVGEYLSGDFKDLAVRATDGSWQAFVPVCGYRDDGVDIFGNVLKGWSGSGRYAGRTSGNYYRVAADRPGSGCGPG